MRDSMPIAPLAAILRLGKKYEIDYLCEEGLRRLRLDLPNTLKQWNTSSQGYWHVVHHTEEYHNILHLCYELSISSCLPTAYLLFVTGRPLASSSSYSTILFSWG